MMKQKIKRKEIELIKQWQETKSEDIAMYFFNKYKDDILNIIQGRIKLKFSSIPLEKGDFFYQVWKSVLECLNDFDPEKGGSFKNLLIRKTYLSSVREAVKFIRNNHIILNNAYSYELLMEMNKNFDFGPNGRVENNNDYQLLIKNLVEEIVSLNEKYDKEFIKRVIYLKSCGFTLNEISKKLNISKNQVRCVISYICKISKTLYD